LNIEGKRSGQGFIAHRESLVNALSKAQAERVTLLNGDIEIGRKGLLGYLKALGGSNMVKVIPLADSASGLQANGKGLKVTCGSNQGYIPDKAWLKEGKGATPYTFCQIKVSPSNTVIPNLGGIELAEALARLIPFASKDRDKLTLQCVYFRHREGKLTLAAGDGYCLGEVILDGFGEGEGEALVNASELKGLISSLKRAKRVRLGFQQGERILDKALVIDTEAISYKYHGESGEFPDYEHLIPVDGVAQAHFDTREALKASQSLLAIWTDSPFKPTSRPLVIEVREGKVTLETVDSNSKADVSAEASGEARIAVSFGYLIQALRACGGMVNLLISPNNAPMLFSVDGYRLLVMPMGLPEKPKEAEAVAEAEGEAVTKVEVTAPEAKAKPKGKRKAKAEAEVEAVAEADIPEEDIAELAPEEARELIAVS